jgi:hypothetical protein
MTTERANRLTGDHRWNETNDRCVVCLMSRRECDETDELGSREYRSGFTFDLVILCRTGKAEEALRRLGLAPE